MLYFTHYTLQSIMGGSVWNNKPKIGYRIPNRNFLGKEFEDPSRNEISVFIIFWDSKFFQDSQNDFGISGWIGIGFWVLGLWVFGLKCEIFFWM